MEKITSSQNPRLKNAIKLHSSRGRNQQERIIIFGYREVTRALAAGVQIEEIFVGSNLVTVETMTQLETERVSKKISTFELPRPLFENLMYGKRSDGIIACAKRPSVGLDRFPTGFSGLLLVVEALENPGNLGAIARSVDGSGAGGIVISDAVTDVFHPNAIRSSLGTVFSIPLAVTTSEEVQSWLKKNRIRTYVASPDAATTFFDVDLRDRCAIVLGNEADGVRELWKTEHFEPVGVPMLGLADSLNVSVTASIFVYEALRQGLRSI